MPLIPAYPRIVLIRDLAKVKKTKTYLIGGFLRDLLLNRPCQDLDFAVSKNAIVFARAFAKKIKGSFVLLDQENGCARVAKKEEGKLFTFDFADFRAKTLQEDLKHRDFTINTFHVDLEQLKDSNGIVKLIKDAGGGQRDLKTKRIRMSSPGIFQEDPLRILRAFSHKALLGFTIEGKTLLRLKKDKKLLKNVSAERIRDEFFKIFQSRRCPEVLKEMDRVGILRLVIPQIEVMAGVEQGGYHHLNVWEHTLEALKQLEGVFEEFQKDPDIAAYLSVRISGVRTRRELIKLGLLLHDIGKPDTQKKEPSGRMSFHGHEHVGKSITRSVANMLKLSVQERHMLEDMVRWHLRPGYLSNFKTPSERSSFRYFRDTKEEAVSILLLSLADQRATRGPLTSKEDQRHHENIIRNLLQKYFAKQKEKPLVRLITGHDLIKILALKPSPLFAEILSAVEEQQALNKITTKKQALELAQKIGKEKI